MSDKHERHGKALRDAIGPDWIELDRLRMMTTTSLIDHAGYCRQQAGASLANMLSPHEDRSRLWAAYGNQADWCLMVLQERGVYEADPLRDDRTYQYIDGASE